MQTFDLLEEERRRSRGDDFLYQGDAHKASIINLNPILVRYSISIFNLSQENLFCIKNILVIK